MLAAAHFAPAPPPRGTTCCGVRSHHGQHHADEGTNHRADMEEEGHDAKSQTANQERQANVQPPFS
jgi:hypothetical protein